MSRPTPPLVVETKYTLDGRAQTFTCTGVLLTPRLVIVRFDHPSARRTRGFFFPAGSFTLGFFWRRRAYNCYRIAGPDGGVIAYRFDVVERVRIAAGHVGYHDLLLDVWVSPEGQIAVEDDDEVAAAAAAGLLSTRQLATIERTRDLLLRDHRRIIAECEREVERAMDDEAR